MFFTNTAFYTSLPEGEQYELVISYWSSLYKSRHTRRAANSRHVKNLPYRQWICQNYF